MGHRTSRRPSDIRICGRFHEIPAHERLPTRSDRGPVTASANQIKQLTGDARFLMGLRLVRGDGTLSHLSLTYMVGNRYSSNSFAISQIPSI